MRFHVVALPHTKVTKEFFSCAYTEKVYGFCNMMTSLGHEVYLYASGDRTDANVTDFIPLDYTQTEILNNELLSLWGRGVKKYNV